jgi:oxygen-dependent protoporphyrinogen oxidase
MTVDAIVVGSGFAGLSAAHRLRRAGHSVLVLECAATIGGRAATEWWEGCPIDLYSTFLTTRYRALMQIIEELGLLGELVPVPHAYHTALCRDGEWNTIDFGALYKVPLFTGLKVAERVALARMVPTVLRAVLGIRAADAASALPLDDTTLGKAASPSVARYFLDPLLEGYTGFGPGDASLGALAALAPCVGRAVRFPLGMGQLIDRMAAGADVVVGAEVISVDETSWGVEVIAQDRSGNQSVHCARAAVIAAPADAAAKMWGGAPSAARTMLEATRYTDGFLVFFRTRHRFHPKDPSGQVLFSEGFVDAPDRAMVGLIYCNYLAPTGGLILTSSTNMARRGLRPEALADQMQAELEQMHPELVGDIVARRLVPVPRYVPAFPVGRARELVGYRRNLAPGPVHLAGDYLYAPIVEGAVRSGRDAADLTDRWLRKSRSAKILELR